MNDLFAGKGPRITVIGGGTGLSVILRGLKRITDNLAVVVTMADDGGSSGMLREDLGMLPPGDIRSCLLAMTDDDTEENFKRLIQYRFEEGMLKGQNMGNLILAAMAKMTGSFEKGLEMAHDLFRIRGRVIPVTCQEITLCARLTSGVIVRGESSIPKTVMAGEGRIESVFLEPAQVQTLDSARKAIRGADIVVIGPGSLYTSIIPNLLVGGIREALAESRAMKLMICNVMTQRGETDDFTPIDHVREMCRYMGDVPLDLVFVNDRIIDVPTAFRYSQKGTRQVLLQEGERERIEAMGVHVVEDDFIEVYMGYVRHDAQKLSRRILEVFDNRDLPLLNR